jgi:hypothetical protein
MQVVQFTQEPGEALLDGLVWGIDVAPLRPDLYVQSLRAEVSQIIQRSNAYRSRRVRPSRSDLKMVWAAQVRYERRLAAISGDANAPSLAFSYVNKLQPCYEWEGFSDCPEREAKFADEYQAANLNGPFSAYLPLLAAHRWLCTAEAFEYEGRPSDAERSRQLFKQRLMIAQSSRSPLIKMATDRLAIRGRCFASR